MSVCLSVCHVLGGLEHRPSRVCGWRGTRGEGERGNVRNSKRDGKPFLLHYQAVLSVK